MRTFVLVVRFAPWPAPTARSTTTPIQAKSPNAIYATVNQNVLKLALPTPSLMELPHDLEQKSLTSQPDATHLQS